MKIFAISYVIPAPGSAVIWLVTNTATLYSKINVRGSQVDACDQFSNLQLYYILWNHCVTVPCNKYGWCVWYHINASDLQRSSAAWRASGPASAAARPARPDQRSRLWTEPWWSQWSGDRKVRWGGRLRGWESQERDPQLPLTAQKIWFWNSYTHQQFEHSAFLVEFCCYKVQQLHLMFTWRAGKTNTKRVRTLPGKGVSMPTDLPLHNTNVYGWQELYVRTGVGPGVQNVFQHSFMVHIEPVGYVPQSVWTTGTTHAS